MTSLFPNINLNEILEIEFQLGKYFSCKPQFGTWEFFEFIWQYERLVKESNKKSGAGSENQISTLDQLEKYARNR